MHFADICLKVYASEATLDNTCFVQTRGAGKEGRTIHNSNTCKSAELSSEQTELKLGNFSHSNIHTCLAPPTPSERTVKSNGVWRRHTAKYWVTCDPIVPTGKERAREKERERERDRESEREREREKRERERERSRLREEIEARQLENTTICANCHANALTTFLAQGSGQCSASFG
eukprot:sb/3471923/